jgi:DNA-binding response OmpR family regulator
MRILVVDDDRVVLESCQRILQAEGHAVVLSSSAKEAVSRLETQSFEILLVDVIMPEYDGVRLIGTVRQRWPDLPILVMSGYPTPETVSSGLSAGATHFIPKPFTPDELLAGIRRALTPKE